MDPMFMQNGGYHAMRFESKQKKIAGESLDRGALYGPAKCDASPQHGWPSPSVCSTTQGRRFEPRRRSIEPGGCYPHPYNLIRVRGFDDPQGDWPEKRCQLAAIRRG